MARFFAFRPPRSANLSPQRRRSQSAPNSPRMCCAPCTSSVRRYGSPSLLMCIWACGLKISDLDLRGGVLSIHRLKGSLFTIQELERHRGIPLLDEVRALKEWLDEGKPVIKLEL